MSLKFDRDYVLEVGVGPYGSPIQTGAGLIARASRTVTILPPYTLEMEIERQSFASSQRATIRIKNLARSTRDVIYKDPWATGLYAQVRLQAGYKGQFLPIIFQGTILEAQSYRANQHDIITEIQAWDGGFAIANSYSAFNLSASQSYTDLLNRFNSDLYGVSQFPIFGTLPASYSPRDTVHIGPTFSLLQRTLPPNVTATIDLNRLLILADGDALTNGTGINFVINSDNGLLDPPVRFGSGIQCRMLFEPRLMLGQYVLLQSMDNPMFNGAYQVNGINHSAIISPTEAGPAYTTVSMFNLTSRFNLYSAAFVPRAA